MSTGAIDPLSARQLLRQAERAMTRSAGSPPVFGNSARILVNGPEAFEVWLEWIAAAEEYVHLENYIIRDDRTGHRFRDALVARARAGVQVRVLYDWLGCWATPRGLWRSLSEAGVEVRPFGPPGVRTAFDLLHRDHRKALVVDGVRASVAGMCIGDEWAGDPERGVAPWRDTGVAFQGPIAAHVNRAFSRTWALAGDELPAEALRPAAGSIPSSGKVAVRLVEGEPGRSRIYRLAQIITAGADSRLWITDPYFVAPPAMVEAIAAAAGDGVDVRLIVPAYNNWPITGGMSRAGYRTLLEAGVRLYEWEGPMIHAKTTVADGSWVRIGSSNLNLASLLGNFELDVAIVDADIAEQMEAVFLRDLKFAVEVRLPSRSVPGESRRYTRTPARADAVLEDAERRRNAPRGGIAARTLARLARAGSVLGRAILGYGVIGVEDRGWIVAIGVALVLLGATTALVPQVAGWPAAALLIVVGVAALARAWVERPPGGNRGENGG